MSKLLITSTATLTDARSQPLLRVCAVLQALTDKHNVMCISSHTCPAWFPSLLPQVQFVNTTSAARQSGECVHELVKLNKELDLKYSDIIILAGKDADALLSFNSQTVLLRAEWSTWFEEERFKHYGVAVKEPEHIERYIDLLESEEPWYFTHPGTDETEAIYALTNAGTMREDAEAVALAHRLRSCLKSGTTRDQDAFKLHLLSSICFGDIFRSKDVAVWGFYPSSDSTNKREEVMAEFADAVRITFKSRRKDPLFIRHKQSVKRHAGGSAGREDPTSQLSTLHVNPVYKGKLKGKHAVVFDDYLTYGCSFGVASALLRAAGAKDVTCIAMGKFGRSANAYMIEVLSDPFRPMTNWKTHSIEKLLGQQSNAAELSFVTKFGRIA